MAKKKNKRTTPFSSADVVNKKKVVIEIDDDLTPEQEALAIAHKIQERNLLGTNTTTKLIGSGGVKVKHLETQIVIKRVSKEIPEPLLICSVCQTNYEKKVGHPYYTNYGGMVRKNMCCSEQCVDVVVAISPDRISKKKTIKPAFLYKHYRDEKHTQETV